MDKFKKYILPILVLIIAVVLAVLTTKSCSRVKVEERVVTITDSITNVKFDTVFLKEVKVEKFKVTDTLYLFRDSLFEIVDSVTVEVPISTYKFDEIFENDSVKLKIGIECSGYDVALDRLYYDLQYKYCTVQQPKKRNRLGLYIGCGPGIGYDYINNRWVPAISVSVGIGVSFKKW